LVKIQTDPKTYAVDKNGTLRWITSESAAALLYGADWAKQVDDVPDTFFTNYKIGSPVSGIADFNPETILAATLSIADDKMVGSEVAVVEPVAPVVVPVIPVTPVVAPADATKPVITSFTADHATVTSGNTVTLSWTSQNATTCLVTDKIANVSVPFSGKLPNTSEVETLSITKTTYPFTLVCADKDANTTTASLTVTYAPTPITFTTPVTATPVLIGTNQQNERYSLSNPTYTLNYQTSEPTTVVSDTCQGKKLEYKNNYSCTLTVKNSIGLSASQNYSINIGRGQELVTFAPLKYQGMNAVSVTASILSDVKISKLYGTINYSFTNGEKLDSVKLLENGTFLKQIPIENGSFAIDMGRVVSAGTTKTFAFDLGAIVNTAQTGDFVNITITGVDMTANSRDYQGISPVDVDLISNIDTLPSMNWAY
jgi:hypothetical protein